MNLTDTIMNFIQLKQEGSYWDFKRQWYEKGHEADMLHDIICMSNTIEHCDAYIIIGVDEENDYAPFDISYDPQKRNTQMMVEFLKGKNFAGDIRPTVTVEHVFCGNYNMDVIVVHNSNHTPFYLKQSFRDINAHYIYTRVQDTNTPKDVSADPSYVELLWKKRFGIDLSVKERLSVLLDDSKKWECDWGNKKYAYHADFPEYQLIQAGEMVQGWWPAAAFYMHPIMHLAPLHIKYHDTIIYETELWSFDEFRRYLPKAENSSIESKHEFWYSYYLLDSIEGKLLNIFTKGTYNISSREPNYNQILIFNTIDDKKYFDEYAINHFNDYTDDSIKEQYQFQIREDNKENGGGLIYSAFHVAKAAKLYEDWKQTLI